MWLWSSPSNINVFESLAHTCPCPFTILHCIFLCCIHSVLFVYVIRFAPSKQYTHRRTYKIIRPINKKLTAPFRHTIDARRIVVIARTVKGNSHAITMKAELPVRLYHSVCHCFYFVGLYFCLHKRKWVCVCMCMAVVCILCTSVSLKWACL